MNRGSIALLSTAKGVWRTRGSVRRTPNRSASKTNGNHPLADRPCESFGHGSALAGPASIRRLQRRRHSTLRRFRRAETEMKEPGIRIDTVSVITYRDGIRAQNFRRLDPEAAHKFRKRLAPLKCQDATILGLVRSR